MNSLPLPSPHPSSSPEAADAANIRVHLMAPLNRFQRVGFSRRVQFPACAVRRRSPRVRPVRPVQPVRNRRGSANLEPSTVNLQLPPPGGHGAEAPPEQLRPRSPLMRRQPLNSVPRTLGPFEAATPPTLAERPTGATLSRRFSVDTCRARNACDTFNHLKKDLKK